jgi:tetratricopeptide (TPR) repeat protein
MGMLQNIRQEPADVAVVLQTILRPSLEIAVQSVYRQDFPGRIHLLIGVDVAAGDRAVLDRLLAQCPDHVMVSILDPGYSTSRRHGGVYPNHFGGSLRTVLSYLANARLVAYLDDNDWFAADHLAALKSAIKDKDWAWSGRWLVHPVLGVPICRDEWDSVGTRPGINADRYGGFVQPSGLMLDKEACHFVLPLWSLAAFPDGSGEDRLVFDELHKTLAGAATDRFTCFCTLSEQALQSPHHQRAFAERQLAWVADAALLVGLQGLLGQARDLAERGDWQGAGAAAEAALAIHPHHPEATYLLGRSRLAAGRKGDAIHALMAAVALDDLRSDWQQVLADALDDSRRRSEARTLRSRMARRFPNMAGPSRG